VDAVAFNNERRADDESLGGLTRRTIGIWVGVTLVPLIVVVAIATFPGELLDGNWMFGWAHTWLVDGDIDLRERKPKSFWSNRLVLPGLDAIDHSKFDTDEKIKSITETVSLRKRDLKGAVLIGADLRKADFTAADLERSLLNNADLREAKFNCDAGSLKHQEFRVEDCSQLQGASLVSAKLAGASFVAAQLQGANLSSAELYGAVLDTAQLQAASLDGAQMRGASLDGAQIQGASLANAGLQAASLRTAALQGAFLGYAQLQGTLLTGAQLQGASLIGAQLEGADLRIAFTYRSYPPDVAATKGANIVNLQTGPVVPCPQLVGSQTCRWTAEDFSDLLHLIEQTVPAGDLRDSALTRIQRLNPKVVQNDEDIAAAKWAALNLGENKDYPKSSAAQWLAAGCADDGAPYVIRALLKRVNDNETSVEAQEREILADVFLVEKHCAGALGLTQHDKALLEGIRDKALAVQSSQVASQK
jgi:uncharacterized protein YjbI with pentapeptide repeats